jgi:hypothetical protein
MLGQLKAIQPRFTHLVLVLPLRKESDEEMSLLRYKVTGKVNLPRVELGITRCIT